MSRLSQLPELRRLLPLTAAGLFLLALTFPVWRITLSAPQYMEPLVVELYAYPRLEGDIAEIQTLNSYVGFYYPDPVYMDPNYEVHEKAITAPEWVLGPVAFVGVAASSVAVALLPTGRYLRYGLTALLAGTVAVFGTMGALIQYRLHQAGHSLDSDAPLSGVEPFTPPLAGTYEVANISGNAWFGPGGYMLAVAIVLLFVAFRFRDSTATIWDLPELLARGTDRTRDRLRRWRGDSDGSDNPTATEGSAANEEPTPRDGSAANEEPTPRDGPAASEESTPRDGPAANEEPTPRDEPTRDGPVQSSPDGDRQ